MINFKKVLTGFMSAAMVLTSMSIPAFADGETDVAKIGDTTYPTLAAAIEAAQSDDTVTIISDINDMESVDVSASQDITIDLNGKTINTALIPNQTGTKHAYAIDNKGTLTLEDSVGSGKINARGVLNNGVLVINGGTYNAIDEKTGGASVWNNKTLTINGGTFNSTYIGSTSDPYGASCVSNGNNESHTVIKGGTFNSANARTYAIVAIGYMEVTPAEGKEVSVYGYKGAIASDAGTLIINGGDFKANNYQGLYVSNDKGTAEVTVNGGTFYGPDHCVRIGTDNSQTVTSKLTINGGTFKTDVYAQNNVAAGAIEITNGTFEKGVTAQNGTIDGAIAVSGGTFSTDVSDYCTDGYKIAKNADGEYVVVPEALTENIKVEFEQVNTGLYNIVLKTNDNKTINRLTTADLTFKLETQDAITYEIKETGNMNVTSKAGDNNRYLFSFDGETVASATDTKIVIGQVEFTGYGTFTFGVDSDATTNIVNATENQDSIVTSYVVGGSTEATGELDITSKLEDIELKPETADLTVNVSFPNAVKNNDADYQDMKVSVSGNGANEVVELGDGVTFDNDTYTVEFTNKLVKGNTYTVTVSGAGYRTARYTVSMTGNKTLNFWNNVKDTPMVIEEGSTGTGVNSNFLAGDIIKDGQINIYDLSAVVSYFGTDNLVEDHLIYAKYDLNRDGVIDSKDVAYVLVSWGK